MIFFTYRSLLNNRRFISFLKYRKCRRKKSGKVLNLLRKKFKSTLFKDLRKKLSYSLYFIDPRKKIKFIPRSFFFRYRISFKPFSSNLLFLYFAEENMVSVLLDQVRHLRVGDTVYFEISKHLNLCDVSFFDDFFLDVYYGVLSSLARNGVSSVCGVKQTIYNVGIKHYFTALSPNIIALERV
jgi:ribosomal protein L19